MGAMFGGSAAGMLRHLDHGASTKKAHARVVRYATQWYLRTITGTLHPIDGAEGRFVLRFEPHSARTRCGLILWHGSARYGGHNPLLGRKDLASCVLFYPHPTTLLAILIDRCSPPDYDRNRLTTRQIPASLAAGTAVSPVAFLVTSLTIVVNPPRACIKAPTWLLALLWLTRCLDPARDVSASSLTPSLLPPLPLFLVPSSALSSTPGIPHEDRVYVRLPFP